MAKVAFTNEIGGAVLSNDGDMASLVADPKSYIFSTFSVDLGASSVSVVENSGDSVNLTLPYYSGIDQMTSEPKSDEELIEASGGEIFITALILASPFIAGAAVAAGAAVGGTYAAQAARGKNLDGSPRKGGKK